MKYLPFSDRKFLRPGTTLPPHVQPVLFYFSSSFLGFKAFLEEAINNMTDAIAAGNQGLQHCLGGRKGRSPVGSGWGSRKLLM